MRIRDIRYIDEFRKSNEERKEFEEEQAKRISITIAEYDELREKIEVLEKKLVFYKDFFQRCNKKTIYSPVDNSMHTIIDIKLDDSKIIFGEE